MLLTLCLTFIKRKYLQYEFRYMLDLMLATDCLEWALLLAILLFDGQSICKIIQRAHLQPSILTANTLERIKYGLRDLETWANQEWYGIILRDNYII